MIPYLALSKMAYDKGLQSGRDSKLYDDLSLRKAMDRFQNKNPIHTQLLESWLEGWRDAGIYRRVRGQ